MTRARRTLFGSFGERLNTAVCSVDWWFFRASDVKLETEDRTTYELQTALRASAADRMPDKIDSHWFRTVAPIGLNLASADLAAAPLSLGLVACRVQTNPPEDLAYPFFLSESETRLYLQFSTTGPVADIQRQIVSAFGQRLLWQAPSERYVAE